jgi:intracellular multiplication protein IcmV
MLNRTKKVGSKIKEGVARGIGWDLLSGMGHYMQDTVRAFLEAPKAEKEESFEHAKKRMKLSEEDLAKRRKNFLRQFFLFLTGALLVLIYSIYSFAQGSLGAGIVAFLMTGLLLVHGLRAHFWAFQIKHRKLGCTINEWWNNKIVEKKTEISKKET